MNTGNRALWTVIGLLLTALGVTGALLSLGKLPGTNAESTLIWPELAQRWRDWGPWALAAAAAAGLIVLLCGLALLRVQLRRHGSAPMADVVLETPAATGRTYIGTNVLTRGLAHDLQARPGIKTASAHLSGNPGQPQLEVWLTVDPETSLTKARQWVQESVQRFTTTTNVKPASYTVTAKYADGTTSRVA
jgi:hypothetical protein